MSRTSITKLYLYSFKFSICIFMTLPASGQAASCKRLIKLYWAETATSLYCFKCNICMFMILPASGQAISCKRLIKLHSAVLSRNAHNVVSHCIVLSRVVLYRAETLTALCCVVMSRNADSVVLCCIEQKRSQRCVVLCWAETSTATAACSQKRCYNEATATPACAIRSSTTTSFWTWRRLRRISWVSCWSLCASPLLPEDRQAGRQAGRQSGRLKLGQLGPLHWLPFADVGLASRQVCRLIGRQVKRQVGRQAARWEGRLVVR